MSNSWFRFKRFMVDQSDAAMKVGTDGVLLGAWARTDDTHTRILDVGTGTGLIALMMAQRTEGCGAAIDAVEIDGGSYRQATANFAASPWADKLTAIHSGVRDLAESGYFSQLDTDGRTKDGASSLIDRRPVNTGMQAVADGRSGYDHIISNPPYFVNSLVSPEPGRTAARHTGALSYGELVRCSDKMLAPGGAFSVILPAGNEGGFIDTAGRHGLYLSRSTTVYSLPGAKPKRVLMEFTRERAVPEFSELTVGDGRGGFTPEYVALTRDFYLKF